jgi:hypothetical protein
MKTAEDSEVSNSIWNIVGNIVKLVNTTQTLQVSNLNVTGNFVALKQYYGNSSDGPGSFNVTGTGWTTTRAVAIPYQTIDGAWRLKFNIRGSLSVADTAVTLTISGVTFKSGGTQAISVSQDTSTTANTRRQRVTGGTGTFIGTFDTAITDFTASGDIELDSKPTWAD